ncbi:collagen alpha-6(VI) chain isoform X2 [Ornithorhynchus anatinus]|uniref:collagen alpha-6(VI) chain isoform X2 n=1 Tax=Ornithorhynchus anatinus TaxID=9258 RepID=UPI0010A8F891|nr:collagen alpha-6(VI) chain isoform X2 [Ornithorhynchus anatinus]
MKMLLILYFVAIWMGTSLTQGSAPEFADVVFLVDSSDNLGSKAFPFVKMFINKMINALPIEASKYRIAVAQYSDDLHSEFLLNTFKSKNPMLNYLKKNFAFRGGSPRLGQALQRAHKTYFSGLTGGRDAKQFPPVLVVLASGPSEDEVEAPAKALQRDGVKIISLGMSAASDRVLKAMATPQYDFHLPKIRDVGMFSSNMTQIIKNIVKDQAGKDDTPLEACKTSSLADIAFLVEESVPGNGRNFENLQTFLKETLSSLDVKENCTRIALVTYGTRTHVISSLRNDTTQEELLQEIENLSPKAGKAFIGAAINVTRKEIFSRGAGSRKSQGVQQIAVLITHRSSEDSVSEAALSLRREGVTVFAIGIKGANETQLDWIVSYPPERYVSTLKTYSDLAIHHGLFLKKLQNEIRYKGSVLSEQTVRLQSGCVETEEADIYFLIDGSGSIRRRDFQDIKTFLNGVIKMFSIAPHKVRIGAVQYSTLIRVEFYIDQYSNQVNLQKAIEGITQYKNRTYTGEALKYMLKLFQDPQWQRGPHVPRHLIILTDGKSDDSVDEPARMLRDAGVNIFAVGVKDAKTAQLQAIAGSEERVYCVQNFDALGALKDVVVRDLCFEEACKMMEADIVFLVDSSGSIGADNFEKMKTFMKNVVNRTKIGADQVQVGLVQFSDINKEEFQLNQYNTKSGVSDAIDRLSQIGRGTLTGSALTFVSDYFHVSKGARPNVKKFLVLLTDGKSQDAVKEAAIALRQGGVTVYSVGVFGSEYSELEEISGSSDMVFYVENFDFLDRVVDVLFFDVCSLYDDCKRIQVLDVVFVIDNSGSLSETQYESIINFTIHLVNRSDVGSDGVQFGALKYSDDPQILFYLNKHTTRSGIIKDLREAKQVRGRTYTAKALRHSNMFFMEENGSRLRRGVKQILIVITDGESHDRYELSASAKALRDKGIIIYAVGVAGAKETELLDIAGSQDKYFYVDSFEKLKDIYKSITNFACGNSQEECNIQEADLVFLCDGSTSISQADFDYMKEFLIEVTNNLDIQPFKVQVGMAQFSHDYQEEFKLNRFSNRLLLTDRINKTIKTEGGTSIGKALRKVRSYFKPDGGSRINAGISQILLLITDGQSQDPVASAAEELRRLGVEILTVGVGDVNLDQLLQITGSPDNILTVGKFQEVKKVKKRVIRNICRPPEKIRCCVDVVVGFDISSYQNGQLLFQDQPLLESYLLELLRPVSHLKGVSCEAGSLTQVRIAFQVQNADRPFTPKFQVYSENILKDLKRVRVTGPTHLSGHFLHSLWDTFQNQSSAQSKVVLVFSDGLKSDEENVLTLEEKSDELRKAGLNALFIISLSRALRSEDIQGIEFGKGFEYRTHLTIGMNGLGSMLSTLVANVAERTCCCEFCKCSGDQGVKGSPGPAASKGPLGFKGSMGHRGEEGEYGKRGDPGPEGEKGVRGCAGERGYKGVRGLSGEKGENGEAGIFGINGEEGNHGIPGMKGEKGYPGYQGSPGSRGSPGDHGPKGVRGDPGSLGRHNVIRGPKGSKGERGRQGRRGLSGVPGNQNAKGNIGREGQRGHQGPKGRDGELGFKGEEGSAGYKGPQGSRGTVGTKGEKGTPGSKGPQGPQGPGGSKGNPGKSGLVGEKGEPGNPGREGLPGPHGDRGVQGEYGRPGYGRTGRKGNKGQKGSPGDSGLKGDVGGLGIKGDPGPKGLTGQMGPAGTSGSVGTPGSQGPPGQRGAKGPQGLTSFAQCDLVQFVRDRSSCWKGKPDCPAYPTELVFAIDMSRVVTERRFSETKDMIVSIVNDTKIRTRNCPVGARVSVVSYGTKTRNHIRLSDHYQKKKLIEEINKIAYERTTRDQNLGQAMRFVAKNLFKRTLRGANVRRIAVFFSHGLPADPLTLATATMEFSALNIIPVVLAFSDERAVQDAFELDDSGTFQLISVLTTGSSGAAEKLQLCTLCYDPCFPTGCVINPRPPVTSYVDAAFLLDAPESMGFSAFEEMRAFLTTVLDNFDITSEPGISVQGDRVALLSYSSEKPIRPAKVEFDLTAQGNKYLIRKYLQNSLKQHKGQAFTGYSLQSAIDVVFSKSTNMRDHKIIFVITAGNAGLLKNKASAKVFLKAKCQGYAIFVLSLGSTHLDTELEALASHPPEHHLIRLGRVHKPDYDYAVGFIKPFIRSVKKSVDRYPPTILESRCRTSLLERDFALRRDSQSLLTEEYIVTASGGGLLSAPGHSDIVSNSRESTDLFYPAEQILVPEEAEVNYEESRNREEMMSLFSDEISHMNNFAAEDNLRENGEWDTSESANPFLHKAYIDVAFLLDGSQNVGSTEFEEMKDFVRSAVENFYIASDPMTSTIGDRVAVLSHAPPGYLPNTEECPVKVEFDLVTYNNLRQMKSHLQESFQQLDGDAFIGHALRWTVDNIFLGTPNPRKNRVIFVVTTGKTSSLDKEVLKKESLRAKCQGYAIFVFSMGPAHGDEELEDLASHPLDHHLVRLGRIHKPDFDYIVRFIKPFIVSVRRAVNQYPSTDIMEKCINISSQITAPPEVEDFLQEHTILLLPDLYEVDSANGDAFAANGPQDYPFILVEGISNNDSVDSIDWIRNLNNLLSTSELMVKEEPPCSEENIILTETQQEENSDDDGE